MFSNGNQRTADNFVSCTPDDDLAQPVTASALAEFAGLDYSLAVKPILDALILSAAQMCIDYTGHDLLERAWTYKSDRHTETQQAFNGLSTMGETFREWISLPVGPVTEITTVEVNGDETDDYETDGQRVMLLTSGIIEISFKAGYTTIPAPLLTGIKMLAVYLFERRGSCSASDAIRESGAAMLWDRYRRFTGAI